MISVDLVLLVVAFLCFLAAAAQVSSPRISFLAAGLAAWVLSLIV